MFIVYIQAKWYDVQEANNKSEPFTLFRKKYSVKQHKHAVSECSREANRVGWHIL